MTGLFYSSQVHSSDPIFAAYDSTNHDIYVANQFSNNVYVIDDVTDQVTSIIPAGSGPVGVAHDPINNKIYVTNAASDDFTIIDGSTNQQINTISSGGDTPATPVYSSVNHIIHITVQLSNDVAIFDPNPPPLPPVTAITSALDGSGAPVQNGGSTRSNQVTFQFTTSGGTPPVILQCSLDNSAFSSCSSPVTCTNLGVGQHTSLFRATDSVALQGPSISFKWRVTAAPPPPDSVCGSSSGSGRLITGTNGDDTLIGSSGTDLIKGNGGYDGINGCNREMSSKVQFFEINQLFHLLYVGSK